MNNFDKLWDAYLGTELKGVSLTDDQRQELRRAFFTGAWCQMKFTRKILGLRNDVAANLLVDLELELSGEVESLLAPAKRSARRALQTSHGVGRRVEFSSRSSSPPESDHRNYDEPRGRPAPALALP